MALSLHRLRGKIATAALVKRAAWGTGRLPGGSWAVTRMADRIDPGEEGTGTYRGVLAQLLHDSVHQDHGNLPVHDPVAGVVPGTPTAPPAAEALARDAQLNPTAGRHIAAAAAYRKPYTAEFRAAYTHYERAHRLNPNDLRAVEGILTLGARTHYEWPRIWRYIVQLKPRTGPLANSALWEAVGRIFAQRPTPEAVNEAVTAIQARGAELASVHQLLLDALSIRLQFLGQFGPGFELRRVMARNRITELQGIPLESALWLKHLLGAYAYLEDDHALESTAASPRLAVLNPRVQTQIEKLRADVALFTGDAEPLQRHARKRRESLYLPGDSDMLDLITGRRVAVVGPAATPDQYGKIIDDHDVVVRTRYAKDPTDEQTAREGSRTDIAYYSGLDLIDGYADAAAAVHAGELQLAVTRPFHAETRRTPPYWLRTARFEYGLYFRGAPQGIQRIIYDLLQFQPTQISLFHADFYAGHQAATPGYRAGYGGFGPHAATNDVVVMHDLAYEFRLMQKLKTTGLLTAHGSAAEVLELSEDDYLQRLSRGPLSPVASLRGDG